MRAIFSFCFACAVCLSTTCARAVDPPTTGIPAPASVPQKSEADKLQKQVKYLISGIVDNSNKLRSGICTAQGESRDTNKAVGKVEYKYIFDFDKESVRFDKISPSKLPGNPPPVSSKWVHLRDRIIIWNSENPATISMHKPDKITMHQWYDIRNIGFVQPYYYFTPLIDTKSLNILSPNFENSLKIYMSNTESVTQDGNLTKILARSVNKLDTSSSFQFWINTDNFTIERIKMYNGNDLIQFNEVSWIKKENIWVPDNLKFHEYGSKN